jgi:hypothetical protein
MNQRMVIEIKSDDEISTDKSGNLNGALTGHGVVSEGTIEFHSPHWDADIESRDVPLPFQ